MCQEVFDEATDSFWKGNGVTGSLANKAQQSGNEVKGCKWAN